MITKNTIFKSVISFAGVSAFLFGSVLIASAAVTPNLSKIITRSDTAITERVAALNKLSTRISEMKNVSDAQKLSIATEVQAEITALTTLKAKIDADTDATVALADEKTITGDYRIYMLVIPQGYIMSSSDRIATVVGIMTTLQTKLQTRITAAQTAGKDVTALQLALTDMTAKMADATVQANTAKNGVASLMPDHKNSTIAASNHTALMSAHANIKTGTEDLKAARKDIEAIIQGLKALNQ